MMNKGKLRQQIEVTKKQQKGIPEMNNTYEIKS